MFVDAPTQTSTPRVFNSTPQPQSLFIQASPKPSVFGASAQQNAQSLVAKGKQDFGSYVNNEKAYLSRNMNPLTPAGQQNLSSLVGGFAGQVSATPKVFKGFTDLSTKLLEKLKGKGITSKQELLDFTNSPDLKQPERDLFRNLLKDEGDKVSVPEFANKVKAELLPLDRISHKDFNAETDEEMSQIFPGTGTPTHENTVLPDDLRGPIADYSEHIYNSPIYTSAGEKHFGYVTDMPAGYFAHSRIEDLPPEGSTPTGVGHGKIEYRGGEGGTRRVIELQSDLFQKGRLEQEGSGAAKNMRDMGYAVGQLDDAKMAARDAEIAKLEPYRNTWHERVIREEVKRAAQDGKTNLQFPTGETAMKIEGLGDNQPVWEFPTAESGPVTTRDLKVGLEIADNRTDDSWIITDVLGDGKFKAVPYNKESPMSPMEYAGKADDFSKESFDISGKVDTSHGVYRRYEKDVGGYLRSKYGATRIIDPQGVSWYEVKVKPDQKNMPIEAFGAAAIPALGGQDQKKPNILDRLAGRSYYERPQDKTYTIRGQQITEPDLDEASKVLFAEISNRAPERQAFEIKLILNTAINRMQQYAEHGTPKTLAEVLKEPNQYQGYGSAQYQVATSSEKDAGSKKKMETIQKVLKELRTGGLIDNADGNVFYYHKPDQTIWLKPGRLFKS